MRPSVTMNKIALVGGLAALGGMVSLPTTALAAPHNTPYTHHRSAHSSLIKRLSASPDLPSSDPVFIRTPVEHGDVAGRARYVKKGKRGSRSSGMRDGLEGKRSTASSKGRKLSKRADGSVCIVRGSNATSIISANSYAATTVAVSSAYSAISTATPTPTAATATSQPAISSAISAIQSVASVAYSAASVVQSVVASAVSSAVASAVATGTSSSDGSTAPAKGNGLGLAWPNGGYTGANEPGYVGNYVGNNVGWYYTWGAYNVSLADEVGLAFVPMLWGTDQTYTDEWTAAQSQWPLDTMEKYAFFLNEPEQDTQANISPADAVSAWQTYMSPLAAQGWKIGAAATSNAAAGLAWVLEFESLCPDCKAETSFYPVHWYDTTAETMEDYLAAYYNATGSDKNLWVTEYACQSYTTNPQCTDDGTTEYHQTVVPWFSSTSYVERWSPFGVMENMQGVNEANALMDSTGAITSLGSWYINDS